ncbi:hypothetical protein OC861_006995, partial [Tilletia horrida]
PSSVTPLTFIKMPVVRNFGRIHRGAPHPAPTPRNNPDSLVDDFNVGGTITNPIQVIVIHQETSEASMRLSLAWRATWMISSAATTS